jgi:hypothetical protein
MLLRAAGRIRHHVIRAQNHRRGEADAQLVVTKPTLITV